MHVLAATIEVGPNIVAVVIALIAFATTVANLYFAAKQRKELKPNGGSSLRDAVDRIEKHAEVAAAAAKLPPPPPPHA